MSFCPLWVMGVVSVQATKQYVLNDIPLPGYASKYGQVLAQHYEDSAAQQNHVGQRRNHEIAGRD